jgi:beta-glucosidase
MLPNINNELPGYENDPVIVSAMREACHHNLYALVNSSAMNGITAESVIVAHELPLVKNVKTIGIVTIPLFIAFAVLWVLGSKKLKKTEAYIAYKELKKQKKAK